VTDPPHRGGLLLRLGFLLLLAGGLVLWGELRRPRELQLDLDLTGALPGEIVAVDVTVARESRPLARIEQRYGAEGAPGTIHVVVRARPGPAEVDVMLVDAQGRARRTQVSVELGSEAPTVVHVR
jgi:hypothetical protein